MHGRYWCLLSSIATVKRVNLSNARVFFRNQMNAVSLKFPCHSFGGGEITGVFFFLLLCVFVRACLFVSVRYDMPGSGREQLCVGPCLCCAAMPCHW